MKGETSTGVGGSNGSGAGQAPTDRLVEDLRALSRDANAVMADLAESASTGLQTARQRAAEKAGAVRDRARGYVVEHPWRTLAMVAGVGAVVGWFLRKR